MGNSNRFDISNRNFIVTGGAQGIGFSVVNALAQAGANVVGIDIKNKPGQDYDAIAKQFSVKAKYFQGDVTDEASLTSAFKLAVDALGSLDGCVTCAGIALEKAFEETTFQETKRLQDVNVRNPSCDSLTFKKLTDTCRSWGHTLLLNSPRLK